MGTNFRGATLLAAGMILALQQPALAQNSGTLTSKIELEKLTPAGEGKPPVKSYAEPEVVVPGDRVRVTLIFTNAGAAPASGVNITNPIPEGLVFDGTTDTNGFGVSVDGGKSFGPLDTLTVAGAVPRAATAADVTHVHWLWQDSIPVGQARAVAFFGKVK